MSKIMASGNGQRSQAFQERKSFHYLSLLRKELLVKGHRGVWRRSRRRQDGVEGQTLVKRLQSLGRNQRTLRWRITKMLKRMVVTGQKRHREVPTPQHRAMTSITWILTFLVTATVNRVQGSPLRQTAGVKVGLAQQRSLNRKEMDTSPLMRT